MTKSPEPTTPTLDWEKAKLHLASVKTNLLSYAGKPGMNPFIRMNELNLHAMELALTNNELTEALHNNIMKLDPKMEPKISPTSQG